MKNAEKYHLVTRGPHENQLGWYFTKLLISLALLPDYLIIEGYKIITDIIFEKNKNFSAFMKYYEKTWIKGFKPQLFSVYKRVHRTNNITERHNRQLKETLQKHSTCIEFLGTHRVSYTTVECIQACFLYNVPI